MLNLGLKKTPKQLYCQASVCGNEAEKPALLHSLLKDGLPTQLSQSAAGQILAMEGTAGLTITNGDPNSSVVWQPLKQSFAADRFGRDSIALLACTSSFNFCILRKKLRNTLHPRSRAPEAPAKNYLAIEPEMESEPRDLRICSSLSKLGGENRPRSV